jgi:hypothetical protein
VLIVASLLALACGLARARGALARELPSLVFCVASALAFWSLATPLHELAIGVAAVAFVARVALAPRRGDDSSIRGGATKPAVLYLVLALTVAAALLFYDLGGCAGSLFVWETGTVNGLGNAFRGGESVLDFTRRQLLWGSGVLSAGDASLFYGAPTYALAMAAGFTTWNLRFFAALCALLSIAVAFAFARRFFGAVAGAATALAMTFSVSVLYHGRYGVAMTATFLAVLLALLCVWTFLDRERHAWWMGTVAAGSLYLATLQYATGRIIALLLLAFAVAFSVLRSDRLRWRRVCGLLSLCLVVALVWEVQERHGARGAFLSVRGEQFFVFSAVPQTYEAELALRKDEVTARDKRDLLRATVRTTAPQLFALLAPSTTELAPAAAMLENGRVVNPYYAPLVVFLLLGLGHSLVRLGSWPHACLLWCALGTTVALLLTTGVDAHRIAILTVPCAIWIGLGAKESHGVLSRLRVPASLRHLCAVALCAGCVLHLADQLHTTRMPQPYRGRIVLREAEEVVGPVVLAPAWGGLETSWVLLSLLERTRMNPGWDGRMLDPRLLHAIQENRQPPPNVVQELVSLGREKTLLLAPAEQFQVAAKALRRRGLDVTERGTEDFHVLRVDHGTSDER